MVNYELNLNEIKEIRFDEAYEEITGDIYENCKAAAIKIFKEIEREEKEKFIEMILEHRNCKKYHKVNGEKWTCLDVILKKLGYKIKNK